ncbi:uncharacterized protein LOC126907749 isoform X2 [Daktulosphaira vitifoliae]|uniref:uncharacterized protein LOC126907749 isoform X2 n=1 Tax=Daktulosphaira vitifoliae TaxID=58002 RepID=UPI0021AA26DB|nr:uncharacterized protein LOC126907749 isoform X2 [Daktulosphaira vitifoliae]
MQQKRNAKFINLLNDIPGPENLLFTDDELQNLLKSNETNEKFLIWNDQKIKQKMWKLECKYTELSLYIMYHMQFLIVNRITINFDELDIFKNILHRMISIYYYTFGHATKGIWLTSITIDALIDKKIFPHEIKFNYITPTIIEICEDCVKHNHLQYVYSLYQNNSYLDMICEISQQINLFPNYPQTLNKIYKYEDVSNIYSFFWDNEEGFKTFIPPTQMFPTYSKTHLEDVYYRVCQNWKKNYFILLLYTDAIKRNLLLVTYYFLTRHCIYLLDYFTKDMESIITQREHFLNLFKIPLNILNEIGVFSNEVFHSSFQNFINYMKNDTIMNFNHLLMYTKDVMGCFNKLAITFKVPTIDFKSLNKYKSTDNQLLLFTSQLESYFKHVKINMGPADYTILRIFQLNSEKNR